VIQSGLFLDHFGYTAHLLSLSELNLRIVALSIYAVFCFILFSNNPKNTISNLTISLLAIAVSHHLHIILNHYLHFSIWIRLVFYTAILSYPFLLLFFVRTVFVDGFRFGKRHIAQGISYLFLIYLLLVVVQVTSSDRDHHIYGMVYRAFIILVVALPILLQMSCIVILVKDWTADLIEPRRRFRLITLSIMVLFDLYWLFAEIINHYFYFKYFFHVITVSEILVLFFLIFRLIKTDNSFFELNKFPILKTQSISQTGDNDPLVLDLGKYMDQEKGYRQEKLSIGKLAKELSIQEYLLRRLINQKLGYRNFNDFVNQYRIEEAKYLLATTEMQILNISMEVGFSSIASFNRIFKNFVQTTPTSYRKAKQMEQSPQK
jgi:AraC-like DNA-binding protein